MNDNNFNSYHHFKSSSGELLHPSMSPNPSISDPSIPHYETSPPRPSRLPPNHPPPPAPPPPPHVLLPPNHPPPPPPPSSSSSWESGEGIWESGTGNRNVTQGHVQVSGNWIEPFPSVIHPVLVALLNFFVPGIGQILIGQINKGLFMLLSSLILNALVAILWVFFIGICMTIVPILYTLIVVVDGYQMADRLKKGYPIMKGECSNIYSAIGVELVESPVFVTNSGNEPEEWKWRIQALNQIYIPN